MTFSDQVRWCRKWGVFGFILAAPLIGAFALFDDRSNPDPFVMIVGQAGVMAFFGAFVLGVFGGVGRPMQKALYHEKLEPVERMRKAAARSLIIRWIWWLDLQGRDRDA